MIKVIEGLPWYEVARQVEEEGKRFVFRLDAASLANLKLSNNGWNHGDSTVEIKKGHLEFGIVDESKPVIDFDGFEWEFFEPYGGVCILVDGCAFRVYGKDHAFIKTEVVTLRESPLYPWVGGECPVPGNVEVTVTNRNGFEFTLPAFQCNFEHKYDEPSKHGNDIINFRLTGKVL